MRITTVALGSFVVGALCMFFWGSHTSTLPQSVFAQIRVAKAVPIVPPLQHIVTGNMTVNGGTVVLDGLESSNDTYLGVTFEYGGGAYKLENAVVAPPVNFRLTGAAANTATFLSTFGLLGCPSANPQRPETNPNQPIMHTAALTVPYKGDLVSPFGQ